MNGYFEKNRFADDLYDVEDIGDLLWRAFKVLSHNVEVRVAMPSLKRKCIEGREGEMEKRLAGSALMMIGACEALLSKIDPEAVEMACEDVEKKLAWDASYDFGDILRAALGID